MSDVSCPYCEQEQEINHDDGYGYEDGGEFEQECISCERQFKFSTAIVLHYAVFCQDGDHDMRNYNAKYLSIFHCANCDYREYRS